MLNEPSWKESLQKAHAIEQMRQKRLTFRQWQSQNHSWFRLRLLTAYAAIVLLSLILFLCGWILLRASAFPDSVVWAASGALFADILGLLVGIWKVVVGRE